jgi:hypothetical protein
MLSQEVLLSLSTYTCVAGIQTYAGPPIGEHGAVVIVIEPVLISASKSFKSASKSFKSASKSFKSLFALRFLE